MSVNSQIIAAVSDLAPCYPWEEYEGSEDEKQSRYFVFNYESQPDTFGDNAPVYETFSVQLHYFCPSGENSLKVRRAAKKAIFEMIGDWPTETNASDNDGQHFCFEFMLREVCGDG